MTTQNILYQEPLNGLDYWVDHWTNDYVEFFFTTIEPNRFRQKVKEATSLVPLSAGKLFQESLIVADGDELDVEVEEKCIPSIYEVYNNTELLKQFQFPPVDVSTQLFKMKLINDYLNNRSIVSFTCSHLLMDGGGSYLYWCIMSSIYKSLPIPPLLQRMDLLSRFPKKNLGLPSIQSLSNTLQNSSCSSKVFLVPFNQFKKYRSTLSAANLSLNDAICGLLGDWIYNSFQDRLHEFKSFELELMVDLRRFLGLESYMGNMCCNRRINISLKELPANLSEFIAHKTREIVATGKQWANEYVCEHIHLSKEEAYQNRQRALFQMEDGLAFRFLFNNLLGFNFGDLSMDGPLVGLLPVEIFPFSATLLHTPDKETFALWISLPAEALHKIEQQVKEFVSK